MFKQDTVIVVGAGASSEFGLPLGAGLSTSIAANLTVDSDKWSHRQYSDRRAEQLLRGKYKDDPRGLNLAFEAGALIQRGLLHAQSIDAFIDMHVDKPAVAVVGKLQIALEILRAERTSALMVDQGNIHNRIDFTLERVASSWLRPFAEILLEKARATDLAAIGRGLTIICFNYDRCIEQYLIQAIEATLAVSYQDAHAVVSGLNIIHPYGSLGPLPSTFGGRDGVPFGADVDHGGVDIWEVSSRLSTFTEEISDTEQLVRIRAATSSATTLACLGFGFQSQNVRLLEPQSVTARDVRIMSTGFGINAAAVTEVTSRMARIVRPYVLQASQQLVMVGVGCGDFMRFNRLSLSAA